MLKTVILAGAGATLAQALSLRPVQTRDHPPLDATFFPTATALARKHSSVADAIQSLKETAAATDRFYDPFQIEPTSLEQFFADVYYEVVAGRSEAAFRVYLQLLHLYNRVLSATTNWMATHARLGALDRVIRLELTRAPGGVTIITFNQDLVLENVLARLPKFKGTWCLNSLYGTDDLQPIFATGAGPVFDHHSPKCLHHAPARLIKLHGSLNWGFRSLKSDPSLTTLFPTGRKQIFVHNSSLSRDVTTMKTRAKRGRTSWYFWPLVIPPIYDKSKVTAMVVLKKMWEDARIAIREADRLVLVGYSLPDADVIARQMLRSSFTSNARLEAVECVNPDASLAARLKDKLDCKVFRLYHDLDAYSRNNPA